MKFNFNDLLTVKNSKPEKSLSTFDRDKLKMEDLKHIKGGDDEGGVDKDPVKLG